MNHVFFGLGVAATVLFFGLLVVVMSSVLSDIAYNVMGGSEIAGAAAGVLTIVGMCAGVAATIFSVASSWEEK